MTLIVGIVALALSFAVPVSAFECPQHFAEAQTAIDRATEAVKTLPKGEKKALVHRVNAFGLSHQNLHEIASVPSRSFPSRFDTSFRTRFAS